MALPFLQWDLTEPIPVSSPYGICCDVLEHIHPDDVMQVLENIMQSAEKVFFSIGTTPDNCGVLIGQELHLTVRPHEWWQQALSTLGAIEHEHKMQEQSLFVVKRQTNH
jgi:3-polyprenyl-4-hydroxybenzoate decarboxylase